MPGRQLTARVGRPRDRPRTRRLVELPRHQPDQRTLTLRPARVGAGARSAATGFVDAHAPPVVRGCRAPRRGVDVDFVTRKIGYAAAELGVIWKTVDAGKTWQQLVNVGYPLYFYGVAALSEDEVVVSGFDNAADFDHAAIVWRTRDGGATWNSDIGLDPYWASRVASLRNQHGLSPDHRRTVWHRDGGENEAEGLRAPDPR